MVGGSAGAPLDFSADGLTFFHNDSTGAYRVIRLNPALLPTAIIASSTVFPVTGIDPPYGSLTTVLNTIINVGGTGSQSYDYESVVSVGLRADGVPAVTTVRVQQTTNTTYAIIFAGSAPIASTEYLRSLNDSKTVTVTTGWGATITATTNTFTSLDNLQVGYPIGPFTVTHEAVASGASEDLEILWVDPMAKVLVFKKIREEFLFGTDTPPFGLLDSTSIDVAKTRIVTYNILLDAKVVELSRTTTSIVPPDSAGRESVGGLTNATGSSTVTEDWNDAYIPFRNPRTSVADGTAAIVAVTNDLGQYLVQYCPNLDAIPVIYGSKDPKPMLVKRFREIIAARTPSPSNTQILNDIDSNNLSAYRFALTAPSGGPMMDCVG